MEAMAAYGGKAKRHPNGRLIRKDARYAATLICTLPVELKGRGDKVLREWLGKTMSYIKDEMPGAPIALALHLDETTPHLHCLIDVRDEAGVLAYKKMFGSRARQIGGQKATKGR